MKGFSLALGVCSIVVFQASSASAQSTSPSETSAAQAVTGQNVSIDGGRALQILVAQSEIKSDINLSNVAVATGGGLLGGLIGAAVDSARAKKAEELIAPVRTAVADLDADAKAMETAKQGFAGAEWFKTNPNTAFSKDASPAGKSGVLDASTATQTAFVEYTYDLSPEFDALRVVEKIEVATKAIPASAKGNGEKRLAPKNLVYSRSVTSIILLPSISKEKEANAASWAADGGKLVRVALDKAFGQIQALTPRLLGMTEADEAALNVKTNKKIVSGGFAGRPQPTTDGSTLLWTGAGFVQTIILP